MPRDTLYYDGQCGLCRRSARLIGALDWFRRVRLVDMTRVPEAELPVRFETALGGIPMRTGSGRVLVGYPAMRRALAQTPLGLLPALFLYLPGIAWIGEKVYQIVAANRSRALACGTNP